MAKPKLTVQTILGAIAIVMSFGTLIAELLLDTSITIIVATIVVLMITISLTMIIVLRGSLYFSLSKRYYPVQAAGEGNEKRQEAAAKKQERKYASTVSSFMGDHALIKYISNFMANSIKDEIPKAMIYLHPTVYSKFYSTVFLIVLAAVMPAGLVILALLRNPLALILVFAPMLIVLIPLMEVKVKISNRKSDTANEFPFFMVYAAALQAAGLSLYTALDRLAEWRILPKIKREALIVKRDYLFFSHNPLLAIENIARDHPDENIKTIFLGYTSVLRSGGDMVIYLNSKVADGLESVIERWRRYAESASTLGEISISVFLMFPSLLIAMSIAFSSNMSLAMMQIYGYMILPLMGAVLVMGVHISQPRFYDLYNMNRAVLIALGASAAFGAATYLFIPSMTYWLTSTLLVFTIIVGTEYIREQSDIGRVEKALPFFLRDITEMMKIGYDINQTLINLPKQRQYNRTFDRLLNRVAEHLEMNMPLRRVSETMMVRSWLCRYTFFILSEIVDTGGGTPQVLESLTHFVNGVVIEKQKTKSTTRVYSFLGYATPAFLSGVIMFMSNMLFPSLSNLPGGLLPISILPNAATLSLIASTGSFVVVLTAFVVGLLIAKIVDMSVYATHHAAICLAICIVSFTFL
jgi:flagellar protein FlaJ